MATSEHRNRSMIVPVTSKLRDELTATGRVLAALDKEAAKGGRYPLNDSDHYDTVVSTLEPLVITTLSATSSVPLTARHDVPGARFDFGAGTPLAHHVTAVVNYLRTDASSLLARNDFSKYSEENTRTAYDLLRQLYGMLLSGIIKQAEADLKAIRSLGAGMLLLAADDLAQHATARRPDGPAAEAPVDIREASLNNPSVR